MGIQVQFLSRFCIVWNVPCFGPKYTLRSPNERKSLEVGVGDFYKHRGLQTILQHGSGASAWPAWCACAGLTFSVLQTLELKAEFLLQFKNYQGKKNHQQLVPHCGDLFHNMACLNSQSIENLMQAPCAACEHCPTGPLFLTTTVHGCGAWVWFWVAISPSQVAQDLII